MNTLLNPRVGNLAGFLACCGMMSFALYAEHILGLEPCPLCMFQRVATVVLGIVFLGATIQGAGKVGRGIYAGVLAIVALAGAGIAGRHVWLQSLPKDQVPACGPDLDFMLDTFPLLEVISVVLAGSGKCADVSWRLFGLSMPMWTLVAFIALGTWGVWVNWPTRRSE